MRNTNPKLSFRASRKALKALKLGRSLGVAEKIGVLDEKVLHKLRAAWSMLGVESDLSHVVDRYSDHGFSTSTHLKAEFGQNIYKHVNVRHISDEGGAILPHLEGTDIHYAYNEWTTYLSQFAVNIGWTRLTSLDSQQHVGVHLDPWEERNILCLLDGQTIFEVKTRGKWERIELQVGDIWWINSTWLHKTSNPGQTPRIMMQTSATLKSHLEAINKFR